VTHRVDLQFLADRTNSRAYVYSVASVICRSHL